MTVMSCRLNRSRSQSLADLYAHLYPSLTWTTANGPDCVENPESEIPVENFSQFTFALTWMWVGLSIKSAILCFKCHSIPIKWNLNESSHRLGQLLPFTSSDNQAIRSPPKREMSVGTGSFVFSAGRCNQSTAGVKLSPRGEPHWINSRTPILLNHSDTRTRVVFHDYGGFS